MNMLRLFPLILVFFIFGCQSESMTDTPSPEQGITFAKNLEIFGNAYAPLTVNLKFTTNLPYAVTTRVVGRRGVESDIIRAYSTPDQFFDLPILGLYAGYENQVELTFFDEAGNLAGKDKLTIPTPIFPQAPLIRINTTRSGNSRPGMHFVNYFGHTGDEIPQTPLMFDDFGDIRWYLNYTNHPDLINLFYDNGMHLLQNGNLIFGDGSSGALYEVNRLGEVLNTWSLQGYEFHHHVLEKPNGNFLVTVNDPQKSTIEDVILEIDRNDGSIVNIWDLNESLDYNRRTLPTFFADMSIDWIHVNALEYDESDNTIIISGRTQGIIKLTEQNEVVWIISPHRGWETAGNGVDLNQFLLQPLDKAGNPINDRQVMEGDTNHPDFEWAWYQHTPILLPNGNLMTFDNGDNRNYTGVENYSRAVEYKIDESNKTIQQVWSYGKLRGAEIYSSIVSKLAFHEEERNVLLSSGAIRFAGSVSGKVIEVSYPNNQIQFEATLTAPIPFRGLVTFHNVQRIPLYKE